MAVADLLYNSLLAQIGKPLESGRKTVVARVNETIVETYRQIGKHIIEFELAGNLNWLGIKRLNMARKHRKSCRKI